MAAAALPPGPRLPRPFQAVLWGLAYPRFTEGAHARFGSTFTVRPGTMPPTVLTTDRDAIATLLTGDPLRKRHGNDVVRPLIGDGAVILIDGEEHLARRKLLLPPFHGERVRGYAELLEDLMGAEVDRWAEGETVEILPIAQNLTIEVIMQAVLGVAEPHLRTRLRDLIDKTLFYPYGKAPPRALAPFTPAVMTYFPGMKARRWWNVSTLMWWRYHDRLMALLDGHIAATRADAALEDRDDILAMLVLNGGIPDEVLREDLMTLIGAGHETTAAAIAWGAVLLAHHSDIQEQAREADERWLGALVREVLRIRPPLPVAATRVLDEDIDIDGHRVAAGTLILIDCWGLHHDPRRHPEPGDFRPERFLEEGAESYSWLPFGGGARRCIGSALAELEIKVALRTIVRAHRLLPVDGELPPQARRGITMVPLGGGRVRVGAKLKESGA